VFTTEESAVEAAIRKPAATASDPDAVRARGLANAARQTVLRRVAPALKHDMVVNLQAVSMMAEMLNARVERGSVTPADLQSNISKLNRLAREAVASCLKVTSWIESTGDEAVYLHQGVEECVNLLAASFNFRGFTLVNEVASTDFEVCKHPVRNLLAASLISMADSAECPCELVVTAEVTAGVAEITVRSQPRQEQPQAAMPPATDAGPRPLVEWSEVQALAIAEGAEILRTPERIAIRLQRAVVTSPLQMAPV